MSGEDVVPRPRDDEDLYIYSEDDIADILSDCFVDLREFVGDDDACKCIDIVHQRMTDDFYSDD